MNPMAKQKFNRLINHNVLLVIMCIISSLQIYNYIRLNKVLCIFAFLSIFILSFQAVTKNITICLFLAIFVANFLLGCSRFVEGHTVMKLVKVNHNHNPTVDKKMIPGFDKSPTNTSPSYYKNDKSLDNDVFTQHITDLNLHHTKYNNNVEKKHHSLKDEYINHYLNSQELNNKMSMDNYIKNIFSEEDKKKPSKGYGKSYNNTSSQGYCAASSNCDSWHYKSKCCVAGCCDTACAEKNCKLN